jgi:hypothetical protein
LVRVQPGELKGPCKEGPFVIRPRTPRLVSTRFSTGRPQTELLKLFHRVFSALEIVSSDIRGQLGLVSALIPDLLSNPRLMGHLGEAMH